jgi:hypothetical protein
VKKLLIPLAVFVLAAVAVVAFVADGHSQGGTPAQRLQAWESTADLGQQIGTLQDTAAAVEKAARKHESLGVFHTICGVYETDAQTYNDSLPSPDATVTQDLAEGYGKASDAAEECYSSGVTNTSLLAKSEADSAKAAADFEAALTRIQAVTGVSVATTTTTSPASTATAFF